MPVTARQLETLIRLSTSIAKARFSKTVDYSDAEMVEFPKFKLSFFKLNFKSSKLRLFEHRISGLPASAFCVLQREAQGADRVREGKRSEEKRQ